MLPARTAPSSQPARRSFQMPNTGNRRADRAEHEQRADVLDLAVVLRRLNQVQQPNQSHRHHASHLEGRIHASHFHTTKLHTHGTGRASQAEVPFASGLPANSFAGLTVTLAARGLERDLTES